MPRERGKVKTKYEIKECPSRFTGQIRISIAMEIGNLYGTHSIAITNSILKTDFHIITRSFEDANAPITNLLNSKQR